MKLFLIRHGETVDNVAGNYAGITDSALTNHGVLQAKRLGAQFATAKIEVKHIFSSDLQRAFQTAEAVREAQANGPPTTKKLEILREQDFGFYEGKQFYERPKEGNKSEKDAHLEAHRNDPGFRDVESKESMRLRMETFVDEHLAELMQSVEGSGAVVVVAHGIILNHLWRTTLSRFPAGNVTVVPGVQAADRGFSLEYLGGWSNTGYLELEVETKPTIPQPATSPDALKPDLAAGEEARTPTAEDAPSLAGTLPADTQTDEETTAPLASTVPTESSLSTLPPSIDTTPTETAPAPSKLLDLTLLIKAVNNQEHLKGLKKTRGGIGNLKHDSKQKTVDSFFKKRRLE